MVDEKQKDAELKKRVEDIDAMNEQQKKLQELMYRRSPQLDVQVASRGFATRPVAASPAQRDKRRQTRGPVGHIEASVTAGIGELMMFGTIGSDWYGEGITAKSVDAALKDMGAVGEINVRANSGGGDVFEGTAIYNALVKHPAKINMIIEGVAASCMTLIAMAGDTITIAENAHWMIHNARGMAYGTADELRQYLTLLDNADAMIRKTYSARTEIDDDELIEMMSFDNWMTAQEALDNGFVDAIDPVKSKAKPHVTPEDSISRTPTQITPERLAAASGYLLALSAIVQPKAPTGSSPQPVPPITKDDTMNKKLRARCVAAGMDEKLDDVAANAWYEANEEKLFAKAPVVPLEDVAKPAPSLTTDEILNLVDAREKKAREARNAWKEEVKATLVMAIGENYPADLRDELFDVEINDMATLRAKILEAKSKAEEAYDDGGPHISFASSQPRDQYRAALRDGLLTRCLTNFMTVKDVSLTQEQRIEKHLPAATRAKGSEDFAHMSLVDIARQCLLADGLRPDIVLKLNNERVAMAALGYYQNAGIRADAAIHTTGSFLYITQDAMNKTLLAGFEESPSTWRGPGRQAASVPDFKTIHRIKLGAASSPPVWPDNTAPEEIKLANEQETYAVEAYAESIKFSWRLLINDDLDALSRTPQLMGDAFSRGVNAHFWQQWTSNPVMSDGQAVFLATPAGNRKRSNLTTGSATPTNTTIAAMKTKMRLMRGLNTPEGNESADILNLTPTFIIAPAALEELVLKQVMSGADPASSGNSAVYNSARSLIPVIEPLLDANSSTAWYLAASPGRVDTCEVTFLQGHETPRVHMYMDNESMAQCANVIQAYAAKFIEHRGVQRHDGA